MSLSQVEIEAVVSELSILEGSRVQKIWCPTAESLVLRLRPLARGAGVPDRPVEDIGEQSVSTFDLFVSLHPSLTRLHLVKSRPRASGPPPDFQSVLRNEIEGLRLKRISKVPEDRVVEVMLSGRHERRLFLELMGRRGNAFLTDKDGVVIAAAAKARQGARPRGSLAGPEAETGSDPKNLYRPLPRPAGKTAGTGHNRFESEAASLDAPFAVSAAVDRCYTALESRLAFEAEKGELGRALRALLARTERALSRIDEEEERAKDAALYRRYGELLKTSLHSIKRGEGQVRLVDWYSEDQSELVVPLRSDLSPKENLDRYFRLARRLGGSLPRLKERRSELENRREATTGMLGALEATGDRQELAELRRDAVARGLLEDAPRAGSTRRGEQAKRSPYRKYTSATGRVILVGRGAMDNDELTFKIARGNDLWLHVRGHPGSHVVVLSGREEEPDQETLLDAGTLAAHFSSARGETLVDVAWTRRKHVRKPKGAPPGLVTVSGERGLMLRLEADRLERLLKKDISHGSAAPEA